MIGFERHVLRAGLVGMLCVAGCCMVCSSALADDRSQPASAQERLFSYGGHGQPLLALHAQKRLPEQLLAEVAERSSEAWERLLDMKNGTAAIWRAPLPIASDESLEKLRGRLIVLSDVVYPHNQFAGDDGDFILTVAQSGAVCFVRSDGTEWEGLYGALRRFRRELGPAFLNGGKWDVLACIDNVSEEIVSQSDRRSPRMMRGWVVTPVALFVPGHVLAARDVDGAWRFAGENWVQEAKEASYTVRTVPDKVTPEGLMQIFVTAIREKHFDLFESCITPERRRQTSALRDLDQHWLAHQAWLDRCDRILFETATPIRRTHDERGRSVETVMLGSRSLNAEGQSIAPPGMHTLRRVAGGRWFIVNYEARL